jgi:hypothetical protein
MAQQVKVILVDDIDGGEAVETVLFSVDGTAFEIDLNAQNAQALRDAVALYRARGRKVRTQRTARRHARLPQSGPSTGELRAWALANGHAVADRGRVSQTVRDAYRAALEGSGGSHGEGQRAEPVSALTFYQPGGQ